MPTREQSAIEKTRAWLKTQRDDLINMSRTNRLLYFKHTKTASMEITDPSVAGVLERLSRGGANSYWDFYLPPREEDETFGRRERKSQELLIADKDAKQIERALHLLERKTNQEFVDKGLWVLYLGLGMLNWLESESDGRAGAGPLVLVPVTIARDSLREPFRLRRTEDDPVVNPALSVKLASDFDISLPTVDDFEKDGLDGVLRKVEALVQGRSGWSVDRRAVLSTFTFQKEAMYRDLVDNEGELVANSMIQLLALGPDAPSTGAFDFEPTGEDQLDRRVPPEDLVSVRDADSTQRTCILAARDGNSFVMDGPPGSGKSQTITNIIAELMHAGKTVLFVSEKAAALEVVHNRLKDANLDEFALQLHSHNATRKVVAAELGRALMRRPTAKGAFTPAKRADLIKRREALSAYAQALNEERQPLGRSLHEVLGSITQLHSVPQAPVPNGFGRMLEPEQLTSLVDTAADLGRAWRPVESGDRFLWRDLKDATQSASRRSDIERDLDHARVTLDELRGRVEAIDAELGLGWYDSPQDGRRLLNLLESLDDRREVPPHWLSESNFDVVGDRCSELSELIGRYNAKLAPLNTLVGGNALDLRTDDLNVIDNSIKQLQEKQPRWLLDTGLQSPSLSAQSRFLTESGPKLAEIADDAQRIADAFSLPASNISINRASQLADLGQLVDSAVRPEASWLNPAVQAALGQAAHVLGELLADYRKRRDGLREVFTEGVLGLDLAGLQVRFAEVHRGLGKLRSAYRDDKRTLSACTVTGKVDRRTLDRLADAVAWKDLADRLTAAESRHADILGESYYQRAEADFDQIASAIEVARRALSLAGDAATGEPLARHLARGQSPDPSLPTIARRLQIGVDAWRAQAQEVMGGSVKQLNALPLDRLREWCDRARGDLSRIAAVVEHVDHVAGQRVSLGFAAKALEKAASIQQLRRSAESQLSQDAELLGRRFTGVDTDWDSLHDAITWTRKLRTTLQQPVHPQIADAILATSYTSADLRSHVSEWDKARTRVTNQFTATYAAAISTDLDQSFDDAQELVRELGSTIDDIGEWAAYAKATQRLAERGLEPVISFCIDQRVAGDQVRPIVERALLEAWADDVMASEASRLGSERAMDRDALVHEFRELDSLQVAHAAARVINSCAQRRPNSTAGEAGVVQREGEKQRRHMPIRTYSPAPAV